MRKLFAFTLLSVIFLGGNALAQDLESELASQIDIIVAADGTGDFTSVMEAVSSVPKNQSSRTVIFVRNGVYYEKIEVESGINKVTVIGESVDSTILEYDDYSGSGELYNGIMTDRHGDLIGTSTSHSLYIDSEDFILMNLTVKNSAGPVGQAVAVNLGGDRTILVRCRILGNQDTFYTWGYGRFYMYDCFIEGNVDFIFGRGVALFDSCVINTNRSSCQITAASTDADWKFGYVFNHCRITGNSGVTGVTMGRPWRENAQTVFMNSRLDKHIASSGWSDWDGRSATCYYAEYNNYGAGSDVTNRVSWSHVLSEAEASEYTMANMFAKDVKPGNFSADWLPNLHTDPVYEVLKANSEILFLDSLQNSTELKYINLDGEALDEFEASDNYYVVELPDNITEAPVISTETLDPRASYTIEYPEELPGYAYIHVTAYSGITGKYTLRFKLVAGLENKLSEIFKIRGNPVSELLKVEITAGSIDKIIQLSLHSINGQELMTKSYTSPTSGDLLLMDISSLSPGMYICRINAGSSSYQQKIIKR